MSRQSTSKTKEFLRSPCFSMTWLYFTELKISTWFPFTFCFYWILADWIQKFLLWIKFFILFFQIDFFDFYPRFRRGWGVWWKWNFWQSFQIFQLLFRVFRHFYFNLAFKSAFQNSAMTIFSWKINVFVRKSLVPYLVDKCA